MFESSPSLCGTTKGIGISITYDGLENTNSRDNLIDFVSTFLLLGVAEAYSEL